MNRLSYLFTGFAAVFCLLLMTDVINAQPTISYEGERDVVLGLKDWKEFKVVVKNNGFSPVSFYVDRVKNDMPEAPEDIERPYWYSTICMEDLCYTPDLNTTPPDVIPAGSEYNVKFTVYTGDVCDTEGHFTLKFFTDGLGGVEFGSLEFNVEVNCEPSSVPTIVDPLHLPYPNPTISGITIPLTAVEQPQRLELFSITGTLLETFEGSDLSVEKLQVETSTMTPGLYYYKIAGIKESRVGTFSVLH